MSQEILLKRQQQVLYDKKWKKFLRRTWLFRFIPFVDFVLAAGSMAIGNVQPESDFDVIIGAKQGRIFTTRFFCVLAFELFGWRRKKLHGASVNQLMSYANATVNEFPKTKNSSTHQLINSQTADKICLNHFVTPKSYRLSPPYNEYWKKLYRNLVPVYGKQESIEAFWDANADWLGEEVRRGDDLRRQYKQGSWLKKLLERIFGGAAGGKFEVFLKRWQIAKIEKSLRMLSGYEPRIKYDDDELEFHPDTARTLLFK